MSIRCGTRAHWGWLAPKYYACCVIGGTSRYRLQSRSRHERKQAVGKRAIADGHPALQIRVMTKRQERVGEVRAVESEDGRSALSIVCRPDGLFECYEAFLCWDDDEDVEYWSVADKPMQGLFGSVDEAERANTVGSVDR